MVKTILGLSCKFFPYTTTAAIINTSTIITFITIIMIILATKITSMISSGRANTGAPILRPQLIAYFAFSRFS